MTDKITYRREGTFISKIIYFPGGEGQIEMPALWDDGNELKLAKELLADKDEITVERDR